MLKKIWSFLLMNLGSLAVAINVHFFLSPNSLATGGVSGLSIVTNKLLPDLSLGLIMLILNIILFIVGFIFLGFQFGAKTIYASLALSFFVWGLEAFFPMEQALSDDLLIQLIIGQIIAASGMALVFHQGASTGGTDIIAMILHKYFSIDVGKGVLFSDIAIAVSSIFIFGPTIGMYAFFGVILNGLVIDYTLQQFEDNKEVVIISRESELVRSFIVNHLGRGATIHHAKGAFNQDDKEVITTILNRKDYTALKRYMTSIDQRAFITVHSMNEILGQNFKRLA
ncbi:YitT family protein [Halobacillus yeomjeoni]|uniref:YitT family protein n=1 Tax=Halobacillus yeomjeoni TaxID=311194 RepID=A0A931HXF9_9BACI|nr:YitT family protein [Halobacillus yeomjeoni]MBH0231201.1 YitT family protein [Halobacillus yeomjeoni]MCA0984115.1 YitT family protein [Halobacillus yeomjeoni]